MENLASGRVSTGFSYPVVGKYACAGGVVSITEGMVLARGVGVDININVASDNEFHADNALAESENDVFESGSMKLTADGLHDSAKRMISGQSAPVKVKYGENEFTMTKYSATAKPPYISVGVIVEYKSNNKRIYVPTVIVKTKFKPVGTSVQTRGKTTSWQTQVLDAVIHRADDAEASWKWEGEDFATEAEARVVLNTIFGIATT